MKTPKSKMVTQSDGVSLSDLGASLHAGLISTIPIVTDKTEKKKDKGKKYDDINVTEFVEIKAKDKGKIMGKEGEIIQKITKDARVIISSGEWVDIRRGKDNVEKPGALVSGRRSNVDKAKKRINELLRSESSGKENKRSKRDDR